MASVEIKNNAQLDRLMSTHPEMQKRLQQAIRFVISKARNDTASRLASVMEHNERHANQAVKSSVYKRILGGNLNIYNPRKRGTLHASVPPQKFLHDTVLNSAGNHRGGNRMKRSAKTAQAMSYAGRDLAYVLRWLETGTAPRESHGGNRGLIVGSRFFGRIGQQALEMAAEALKAEMDKIIKEEQ